MIDSLPILLTFKNGWVYIVFVKEIPKIGSKENHLKVIQLFSGYKGQDNREIQLTHSFIEQMAKIIEGNRQENEYGSVLILDELMSVTPFMIDQYRNFNPDDEEHSTTDDKLNEQTEPPPNVSEDS